MSPLHPLRVRCGPGALQIQRDFVDLRPAERRVEILPDTVPLLGETVNHCKSHVCGIQKYGLFESGQVFVKQWFKCFSVFI